MATQAKGAKQPYHHGNLPEALKAAAVEMLDECDLSELSLRKVAKAAGVSPTAPYRHFASRDALLAAIAVDGYALRTRATRKALAKHEQDPVQRFLEAGVQYVLFAHTHPGYYAVMSSPELADTRPFPDLHRAAAESTGILMEAITESLKSGHIKSSDPRDIAAAAWASVHGLASLIRGGQLRSLGFDLDGSDEEIEELARRITRTLLLNVTD